MRNRVVFFISSVFTLVGGIVGVGFVTGREVGAFFTFDASLSGVLSFFIAFALFMINADAIEEYPKFNAIIKTVVSILNLIVLGCIFSAVDVIAAKLFRLTEKVKLFSITIAIFAFIISRKNLCVVKWFVIFLVPLEVVVLLLIARRADVKALPLTPSSAKGIIYPALYAGINFLLNFQNFIDAKRGLTRSDKIRADVTASFLVSICALAVVVSTIGIRNRTPLLSFVESSGAFYGILIVTALVACFISSLTTARSAFRLFENSEPLKFLLILAALAVSEAGFSFIIDKIYPIIGAMGVIINAILLFLRIFSQKSQQARTSFPQGRIV